MTPADQNAGITEEAELEIAEAEADIAEIERDLEAEEAEQRDLDKLYMSKQDVEIAARDSERADEVLKAFFSDDDVSDVTAVSLFDGDTMTPHDEDWVYSRSDEPMPFPKHEDWYIGPALVNVPWWER